MKAGLLEAVVKEMQIGVLIVDARRRLLYANPFFDKTFSVEGKVDGRDLAEVVRDPSVVKVIDEMLFSTNREPREIALQGKGDQLFEVRLTPFWIDAQTKAEKVLIGFFHDVTEEKKVEAIKRDFVSNVSHELRTPLSSIKGYAETLLDGALEDKATLKKFLGIIDRHANRMTTLINDLLTLSMIESHQMPMCFEPLDIKELLNSVVQGFDKQARDKNIELVFDCRDLGNEFPEVMGDRGRLEQVIVNLVDNAIKYTNNGAVRIYARKNGGMFQVDVEDTGIGIPEKDIQRIFERFYRVDKGRSRELGGTGLGLAIVKHIIQGHNGKIWVKSQLGKGSTFIFALPLQTEGMKKTKQC